MMKITICMVLLLVITANAEQAPWTLEDAIAEIVKLRVEHREEMAQVRQLLENKISAVREELAVVNLRVVPIGSTYVEYSNQPSPQTLWPDLEWEDVTSIYAGLFFRAEGGDSARWGVTQNDCVPRVAFMDYNEKPDTEPRYQNPTIFANDGWSEYGLVGAAYNEGERWYEAVRFYTEGCEVRPRNQAIRIWKRSDCQKTAKCGCDDVEAELCLCTHTSGSPYLCFSQECTPLAECIMCAAGLQ